MAKEKKPSDFERIASDIEQFEANVAEVEANEQAKDAVELAKRYCEDARYFLAKKDLMTAFGCINYAHGLIDAYRKKWKEK